MNLTRRQLIGGLAASSAFLALPTQALDTTPLTAQVADMQLLPENYERTTIWGYGGTMPGPEIRVAQGSRVQRQLINDLPQATSTHWHGIRIDNTMDGVSGLTQSAVEPGAVFDYDFIAPDAGTYWYHAHNRSFEQVARGLYGALIVEESSPPDVDGEDVLMLDDWLVDPATGQIDSNFESPHDRSHAGRNGNFIATNGVPGLAKSARKNERRRLRIINAANARLFQLRLEGLDGWIVALDGMPLSQPEKIRKSLILGPAQRADVFVDVTADVGSSAYLHAILDGEALPQVRYDVTGQSAKARRNMPKPLPINSHQMVKLEGATALSLNMEGGAMGSLRAATLNGERLKFRQLVRERQFWAFNGAIGTMENPPLAKLSRGENVRLRIHNDTAFPHAMHLHGMHFHEVTEDGRLGPLRDTTLLFGDQTREIAFVADNPGKWLLHCHMLSHAASGMMTRIEVA
jgi:FtsP/CotA-like multicopper oxidase with cupredoxin domain